MVARQSALVLALSALAFLGLVRSARAQELDAFVSSEGAALDAGPDESSLDAGSSQAPSDAAGGGAAGSLDGGAFDAGHLDAGVLDAGALDGSVLDAGALDGGVLGAPGEPEGAEGTELTASVVETVTAAIASETTGNVVRTLLGLVALLALAWIAGHERVRRFEERLGIAPLMVSGLPFVLLGLVARAPGIEVLSEDVVSQLTPLLQFGLGWIGFHTGFQLDTRASDRFPRGSASVVILLTAVPFALITAVCVPTLYLLGLDQDLRSLLRDATLLGLAGALSAPAAARLTDSLSPAATELVRAIGVLDDVVGVVAFACVAAWLRPDDAGSWVLPEVGWVFVTFGIAAVLGLLTYLVLRGTDSGAEKISLLLGSVCLTTGIAAVFSLPPLVVCFLAGALLRNLPGDDKQQLEDAFSKLERPIYHLFLLIVGALWRPELGAGWALMPAFLAARTLGRWGGARLSHVLPRQDRPAALAETDQRDLVLPPMGQLAIAFVITAQTLYESTAVRAMVNAVVVSAVVLEVSIQALTRRRAAPRISQPSVETSTDEDAP